MALSRFCEPFLFSRTRKTVRSLKKKRSEIIGARRSSCSRHFQGAFLGGGYPGLKPCMCTARNRVLPRSSSSSSSFSTSLDAGNAPIANNVQRSRTRTRTTTRTIWGVPYTAPNTYKQLPSSPQRPANSKPKTALALQNRL
jgi:hypothetical protein